MILVFQSYMFKNFNVSKFEYLHESQKRILYQMRYETTPFKERSNMAYYAPPSFTNYLESEGVTVMVKLHPHPHFVTLKTLGKFHL